MGADPFVVEQVILPNRPGILLLVEYAGPEGG